MAGIRTSASDNSVGALKTLIWVQLFSDDGKRKSWNDSQGRFAA